MTARRVLFVVAILFAIGEALDSIDVGLVGAVFAVLFAVGALLMWRGSRAGIVLVGALVVLEVAARRRLRGEHRSRVIQVPFLISDWSVSRRSG